MSNKVYIVTKGRYSDYHIKAVFKDKEKAKSYSEHASEMRLEEYEIGNVEEEFIKNNIYSVLMDKEGNVKKIYKGDRYKLDDNLQSTGRFIEESDWMIRNSSREVGDFEATVLARDEDHAIKIASELKLQESFNPKNNYE